MPETGWSCRFVSGDARSTPASRSCSTSFTSARRATVRPRPSKPWGCGSRRAELPFRRALLGGLAAAAGLRRGRLRRRDTTALRAVRDADPRLDLAGTDAEGRPCLVAGTVALLSRAIDETERGHREPGLRGRGRAQQDRAARQARVEVVHGGAAGQLLRR